MKKHNEEVVVMDETEYLLKSPANEKELLESIEESEQGKTTKINACDFILLD